MGPRLIGQFSINVCTCLFHEWTPKWFNERKQRISDHLRLSRLSYVGVGVGKNFANLFFHRSFTRRYQSLWHFLITKTHLGTQLGGVLSTSQAAKYLVGVGLEFDDIRSNFDIFFSASSLHWVLFVALALITPQTIGAGLSCDTADDLFRRCTKAIFFSSRPIYFFFFPP
jgi:hypothetical protein